MPCSCFGKPKDPTVHSSDVPYGKGYIKPTDEGDFVSRKNKNHTYLSPDKYEKRDSYLNDSSVSKSNTPSTAPALASTPNSSLSASPSASPASYRGALRRCELEEKRKEFFRDYFVIDETKKCDGGNSATLPASVRPRSFGESRPLRPVSQPNSIVTSPLQPPPPPGPHLLRPVSPQAKIKTETFASPVFLQELRTASEEISRRWQMSEEERDASPCSLKGKVKVFPVTYVERNHTADDNQIEFPDLNTDIKEIPPELNTEKISPSIDFEEINFNTHSQSIHINTGSPENNIKSSYGEINDNKEYSDEKNVPLEEKLAPVGIGPSSEITQNLPLEGDQQPPSPTNYASPTLAEAVENDTQIIDRHGAPSSLINIPDDFSVDLISNIPLKQELCRISESNEPTGPEEINISFSSDEIAEELTQHAWQEDEVQPLLEEDEELPPYISHDTSPQFDR